MNKFIDDFLIDYFIGTEIKKEAQNMAHLLLYIKLKSKLKKEKILVKDWLKENFPNQNQGSIMQMFYKKYPIHEHIKTTIEKFLEE